VCKQASTVCALLALLQPQHSIGVPIHMAGFRGTPVHIAASNLAKTKEKLFIRNVLPNEQREALKTTHTHSR